jgi:hypothetical protein
MFIGRFVDTDSAPLEGCPVHMSLLRSEEGFPDWPIYKHVTPPE